MRPSKQTPMADTRRPPQAVRPDESARPGTGRLAAQARRRRFRIRFGDGPTLGHFDYDW